MLQGGSTRRRARDTRSNGGGQLTGGDGVLGADAHESPIEKSRAVQSAIPRKIARRRGCERPGARGRARGARAARGRVGLTAEDRELCLADPERAGETRGRRPPHLPSTTATHRV